MPDWLLTTITRNPPALRRWIAPAAPGSSLTLPGSCRKPASSTIVPSRSRKTARLATQRCDHRVDLFRENGARVEEHPTTGHTGNDRRIIPPQALGERLV